MRCIMDTTDPEITFDETGECSHCQKFDQVYSKHWFPNEVGQQKIDQIVRDMKADGKNKDYDCIIGLSGGVDSSYLAYQASKLGLRILAVHVDGGWNSELAVKNIESIVSKLGLDLHTHVVDWEMMQDMQKAYFRSGIANQDVPQDHAFFAALYSYAVKNNIRYVLNGYNIATESVLPGAWGYNAMDGKQLVAIHKQFGDKKKIVNYPVVNFFDFYLYFPFIKKMKVAALLNYMPYSKAEAIKTLEQELGWRYYGGKHYESRFTKFFQSYYLPMRFGYDKRKAHLSSLILSGQMTRSEALKEMEQPTYDTKYLEEDMKYVVKKLGISKEEFDRIFHSPLKTYKDYPSNEHLVIWKAQLNQKLRRWLGR